MGSLQSSFQDETDSKEKTPEKRTNGSNIDMVLPTVPIQISADDQHLISWLGSEMLEGSTGESSIIDTIFHYFRSGDQHQMISYLTILASTFFSFAFFFII